MKKLQISIYILAVSLLCSCTSSSEKNKSDVSESNNTRSYVTLDSLKLHGLGVFIAEGKVMYNNKIDNVGVLNIVIKDRSYSIGEATTIQTNFDFYPRYITTLDTIQLYAYNLQGKDANTVEEAQKWNTFEKLIPVVVEQKQNGQQFGESLVFWFTRTESLKKELGVK